MSKKIMTKIQINKQLITWQIISMVMRHCFVKSSKGIGCPTTSDLCRQRRNAPNVLGYWRYVAAKSRCRWLGQENLATLVRGLEERLFRNKGFSVRNMQCMIQFFNEYNQELTMVKGVDFSIAQSMISQLGEYNFFLPYQTSRLDA